MDSKSSKTYTQSWDAGGNRVAYQEPWGEAGAFSTLRLDVGSGWSCPYFIDRHVDRLFNTFEDLGWSALFKPDWVEDTVKSYIEANVTEKGRYLIRMMMSDVILSLRIIPHEEPSVDFCGYLWTYERPYPLHKTLDYEDILSALENIDRQSEEWILLDSSQRVLEGTTTCPIFVNGSEWLVPAADRLESISMGILCESMGIDALPEAEIHTKDIKQFNEILLCGSGKGVVRINNCPELDWQCCSVSAFRKARLSYDNFLIDHKYTWID